MNTDQEIIGILKPHFQSIRDIYEFALEKVNEVGSILDVKMYKRLKANALNNVLLEKAKEYFRNFPNIRVDDRYESLRLVFNESFAGRFKKLSKYTLLPKDSGTVRSDSFIGIQTDLFGNVIPLRPSSVEIGYVINDPWTGFLKMPLIKRIGKEGTLLIDILSETESKPQTIQAQPIVPYINHQEEEKQLSIRKNKPHI